MGENVVGNLLVCSYPYCFYFSIYRREGVVVVVVVVVDDKFRKTRLKNPIHGDGSGTATADGVAKDYNSLDFNKFFRLDTLKYKLEQLEPIQ